MFATVHKQVQEKREDVMRQIPSAIQQLPLEHTQCSVAGL